MYYLFPNGAGAVSILLLIITAIVHKTKMFKATNKITVSFMFLFSIYTVIGCIVLFRSPFRKTGDVYFSQKTDTKLLAEKVGAISSANDFIDILIPENKTLIAPENEQQKNKTYKYYISEHSRVEITVISSVDKNLLKEEYLNEIENEKKLRTLSDKNCFQFSVNDTNEFCIFPIAYDGTKFLLPFAESNGATFNAYFYFGNSYVFISESATNIYDLAMPQYLNKFINT